MGVQVRLLSRRLVVRCALRVSPRGSHLCGVWTVKSARLFGSWGRGEDGQLVLGDTNDQYKPVLVEALKDKLVMQIACGIDTLSS